MEHAFTIADKMPCRVCPGRNWLAEAQYQRVDAFDLLSGDSLSRPNASP